MRLSFFLAALILGLPATADAQWRPLPATPAVLAAPPVAGGATGAESAPLALAMPRLAAMASVPVPPGGDADDPPSYWLAGAVTGFAAGAAGTYAFLHSGGSSSLCDRSSNQDAMSAGECAGLTVLGGVVGAAIGAFVGSRIHRSD